MQAAYYAACMLAAYYDRMQGAYDRMQPRMHSVDAGTHSFR